MNTYFFKRGLSVVAALLVVVSSFGRVGLSARAAALLAIDPPILETRRVSEPSGGGNAVGDSSSSAISADGQYVVFTSTASNLVSGDTNTCNPLSPDPLARTDCTDVFRHDMQSGVTIRVSVANGNPGAQANHGSSNPSISGDGRYVVFQSDATNLVSGDDNSFTDIFIRDTQLNTTKRVSVSNDIVHPSASGWSHNPVISADGNFVVFQSSAYDLIAGDSINGPAQIFVRNLAAETTTIVSVDSSGNIAEVHQGNQSSQNPAISGNGQFVVFDTVATNLTTPATTSGRSNVFMHNRTTHATTLISKNLTGGEGNNNSSDPSISADGRYVAFTSNANNLVAGETDTFSDVYVRDTQLATTICASLNSAGVKGNLRSSYPMISGNGVYVAFTSSATNLVGGDTNGYGDIFVRDITHGKTNRVSLDSNGEQANFLTSQAAISSDGSYLSFESTATNLVDADTNNAQDVFFVSASGALPASGSNPARTRLTVGVSGTGSGTVTSDLAGINCGVNCLHWFAATGTVTLTATAPDSTTRFTGWTGDCSGTGTCVVNMSSPRTVGAEFVTYSVYLPLLMK